VVSVIAGFFLLFAITWAIQNTTSRRPAPTLHLPPASIFMRRHQPPDGRVPAVHLRGRAVSSAGWRR